MSFGWQRQPACLITSLIRRPAESSPHGCCLAVQVCLRTEHGEYACSRAAASYRAKFQHLQEQAAVLHEVSSPSSSACQLQLSWGWRLLQMSENSGPWGSHQQAGHVCTLDVQGHFITEPGQPSGAKQQAVQVVHGLDPKHGGSAELTVEEAAARLTRAKVQLGRMQ